MCEPGCFLWTKAKERKLDLKATHFLHQRTQTRKLEQGPLGWYLGFVVRNPYSRFEFFRAFVDKSVQLYVI